MFVLKSSLLAALSLVAARSYAQVDFEKFEEITDDDPEAQTLVPPQAVTISTSFPSAEIFGVKLVNGRATSAVLSISNQEVEPVRIAIVGASLQDLHTEEIVRNLTTQQYNVEIPAGTNQSLTYNFATELHPRDLRLVIAALVTKGEFGFQQIAFNGTVSVIEAPFSVFDPEMIFLYLFLASCFAATCYFIYSTWIATLFPQKRRDGKGGERAHKSSRGSKVVDPSDQVAIGGADGPAVVSGATLDPSWIQPQHLKRPEAKRIGSSKRKTTTNTSLGKKLMEEQ